MVSHDKEIDSKRVRQSDIQDMYRELRGAMTGMKTLYMEGPNTLKQCLSQDLDFSQKRSYLIFLGSYLQKRGVIHSQRKLRDKARKLRERVRSLYILHAQNTKIVAS